MEHDGDCDTICNWCTRNDTQRLDKGTGRVGNRTTNGKHPNYSIIEIDQNTENSPEDLRRLAVIHSSMKDYQLTLVRKTKNSQEAIIAIIKIVVIKMAEVLVAVVIVEVVVVVVMIIIIINLIRLRSVFFGR